MCSVEEDSFIREVACFGRVARLLKCHPIEAPQSEATFAMLEHDEEGSVDRLVAFARDPLLVCQCQNRALCVQQRMTKPNVINEIVSNLDAMTTRAPELQRRPRAAPPSSDDDASSSSQLAQDEYVHIDVAGG